MTKNAKIKLKIIIAIVLIISISATIFAYARYVSTLTGQGTATVARWSFKVNDSTSNISINLAETINNTNGKVASQKIAPGTSGSFDIEIDAIGSETEIYWKIKIGEFVNLPRNLKFYETKTQGVYSNQIIANFGIYEIDGNIALADVGTPVVKTIYWDWPYETGTTVQQIAQNDIVDNQDSGKEISCNISVIGEQAIGRKNYPLVLEEQTVGSIGNYKIYGNTVQSNVPIGYTQLEYIQTDGFSYIDLEHSVPTSNKLEMRCAFGSATGNYPLFGAIDGTSYTHPFYGLTYTSNAQLLGRRYAIYSHDLEKSNAFEFSYNSAQTQDTEFHTFTTDGNFNFYCDNVLMTQITQKTFQHWTPTNHAILFGRRTNSGLNLAEAGSKYSLYKEMDTNGTVLYNLIPAKRNSDNVIGMYDTVNNKFYTTPAGTGEFIAGNNVVTPTPETPIEVNSLGESGNINVVTSGKNLFNRSTAQENKALRWLDGQLGAETGSITSDFIDVIPNEYYVTNYYAQWMLYDNDNNFLGTLNQAVGYFKGKIPSNATKIKLGYRATYNQGTDLLSANIQFERGNVTSTYELYYAPTTTTIDLTGHEPLRKIGDVSDYVDYENGKIIRNIGKHIFDGTEFFTSYNTTLFPHKSNTKFLATHSIYSYNTTPIYYGNDSYLLFVLDMWGVDTREDLKTLLASMYENGTPLIVYYVLPTTVEEDITLPSIPTIAGTNIITATGGGVNASNIEADF